MKGACNVKLFLPPPPLWGPSEGQKVKYHLISITKSISKILYQTLCVFSQMKDTKHIRRDFQSVPWVMPQGWDFGALGVPRGSEFFFSNMVMIVVYQIDRDQQNRMQVIFILGSNWWPWGEVKGQTSLTFGYYVNFKDFYNKFCVCSHKHIRRDFYSVFWVMPQG